MTKNTGTIIVHDYFDIKGGGERLVLTMAQALDAEILCGFRSSGSFPDVMYPRTVLELGLPVPLRRPGLRTAVLSLRFAGARRLLRPYSTRIFSGVSAPLAAEPAGGARNVYYCHSPPRFLYDQRSRFSGMIDGDPLRKFALGLYRRSYEAAIGHMDLIIANSETVRGRIRTFLGRDAEVVYPPCDLDAYQWLGQQDYYLSTARHTKLKRVDLIVKAFARMPEKQLVVASGGDETTALRELARNAPNIHFTGWTSDRELQRLMGEAIATVYAPIAEDFGMSAVESMAAGKPVIGVAEGGLLETVVDGETGSLIASDLTVENLIEAVRAMTPARAALMRHACVARAGLFSRDRFVGAMRQLVAHLN